MRVSQVSNLIRSATIHWYIDLAKALSSCDTLWCFPQVKLCTTRSRGCSQIREGSLVLCRGCRLPPRPRSRRHSTSSLHRATTVVRMGKLRVPRSARLFLPPPSPTTNSWVHPAANPGASHMHAHVRARPFYNRGWWCVYWAPFSPE